MPNSLIAIGERESTGVRVPKSYPHFTSCTEPENPAPCPIPESEQDFVVLEFPVKAPKGQPKVWKLMRSKAEEYCETYRCDPEPLMLQLRKARQWCIDSPAKQKTATGMGRFLNGWLSKANNHGELTCMADDESDEQAEREDRELQAVLRELWLAQPDEEKIAGLQARIKGDDGRDKGAELAPYAAEWLRAQPADVQRLIDYPGWEVSEA